MNCGCSAIIRTRIVTYGYFDIAVSGRCMEPLLKAGDKVRVFPKSTVHTGDIALIELENGKLAIHRIVAVDGEIIASKGDYSGRSERIIFDEIIGVVGMFSLDGSPWAADERGPNEIAELVSLSLLLSVGSNDCESTIEIRKLLWESNRKARQSMLGRVGRHSKDFVESS